MIPTMLAVGLIVGLLPRWWPRNLVVTGVLSLLVSLSFGAIIGEPAAGTALALANTAVGVAFGRLLQLVVPRPVHHRVG